MKNQNYKTVFVKTMPSDEQLEEGVVYVAPHFEVSVHKCMCGCGEKVVLPLNEGQWKWKFNGLDSSFFPSVGNFNYKCRSHYFLKNGQVLWC